MHLLRALLLASLGAFTASQGASCRKQSTTAVVASASLPGAEPYSAALVSKLAAAVAAKGEGYEPRTRHRKPDGAALYTNRLIMQPSPYLGQHAHNPVNWYPWGAEAFEAAKRLDRPVLLSIGYSTCHWCHVMEEESFEDVATARYINENYIAIKVDREERPDVDSIYMSALHAMGQSGGWPLNVWLTPDRKPFYGGTYFPPEERGRRPAFTTVLSKLKDAFDGDRSTLLANSENIAAEVSRMTQPPAGTAVVPGSEVLDAAAAAVVSRFDAGFGGLRADRRGSKFPSQTPIRFLLRYARRSGDAKYSDMAIATLDAMAAGGMYDQAAGGFHRYSTDPRWLVPHFEKMLYDNALLVSAYVEAFLATGDSRHAEVARHVLAYVAREMRNDEGAFYSATDADSVGPEGEREEGYYFTWTPDEIEELFGADQAKLVTRYFGVSRRGNFEGRSILHVKGPVKPHADALGISEADAEAIIRDARETLYRARQKRPAPHTDDKALVAWNGLMISAFAQAARALGPDEERSLDYLELGAAAAKYILEHMREDGRLQRSSQAGVAHLNAYLDDYAFFIAALLDLYSASADVHWLDEARALQHELHTHYADEAGGYFMTANDHEELLTREKPASDGAVPSGNSYAILNALRLYQLTGAQTYLERADAGLRAFGEVLRSRPLELSEMLLAVDFRSDAAKQVVLVGPQGGDLSVMRAVASQAWLPNHVYVETSEGAALEALAAKLPLVGSKLAIDGNVTAYVCEDSQCALPTSDPEVFREQLGKVRPLPKPGDAVE